MGVHLEGIPEVASCPSIPGTRLDYLRQKLEQRSSDLAASYGAGRLTVDSCTAITWYFKYFEYSFKLHIFRRTEWLWTAIGLVAFGLLMAGLIVFCRGRFRRRTPGLLDTNDQPADEPEMAPSPSSNWEVINGYDDDY